LGSLLEAIGNAEKLNIFVVKNMTII